MSARDRLLASHFLLLFRGAPLCEKNGPCGAGARGCAHCRDRADCVRISATAAALRMAVATGRSRSTACNDVAQEAALHLPNTSAVQRVSQLLHRNAKDFQVFAVSAVVPDRTSRQNRRAATTCGRRMPGYPINCRRYRILVTQSGTSFGLSAQSRHVPFSFSVQARLTSSGKRRCGQKCERASKLPCYHCQLQADTAPSIGR